MNTIFRKIAMAVGAALMVITPVHAVDLTINFTGSFARGTCAFSVANVNLGTYAAPDFATTPTTPWQRVRIVRNSCTTDISMIHTTFTGTAHPSSAGLWRVNTIAGLAVEMQNMDTVPVRVSPGTVINWPSSFPNYELNARFSRVSAITSYGAVSIPVTLNFTYN
jgi:type 1 fimbria pilin